MKRMNRIGLYLVLAVFIGVAQQAFGQEFSMGFFSGMVISSIDDNDRLIGTKSYNTGLAAGGNVIWHLSEYAGLRAELGYERKGNTRTIESYDTQGVPVVRTVTSGLLDYISLSFPAEFSIGNKAKILMHLGPSVNFLLKYTKKDTYGVEVTSVEKLNHTFAYNKIDISLLAGLGMALPLDDKWTITAESRYFRGFVSLPKELLAPEQQNFGFIAALGMRYVIK